MFVQHDLFPKTPPTPEGFLYYPEAISATDETRVLDEIRALPFREFQFHGFEGKRRGISFGWRYDFSQNKALPTDPIPEFLLEICRNAQ